MFVSMPNRTKTFLICISVFVLGSFSSLSQAYTQTPDMSDLRSRNSEIIEYCAHTFGSGYDLKACDADLTVARDKVCELRVERMNSNTVDGESYRNYFYWCEGLAGSGDIKYTAERKMGHWTEAGYIYKWHDLSGSSHFNIFNLNSEYKYRYFCPPADERFAEYDMEVEKNGSLYCAKPCEAPFEDDGEQCVKYCPPNASQLDLDLGRCVPRYETNQCAVEAGNPINSLTGEKIQFEAPDYQGSGLFPINFARNYRSFREPLAARLENKIPIDEKKAWVKYIQPRGYKGASLPVRLPQNLDDIAPNGFNQWQHNYHMSLLAYKENTKILLVRGDGKELYFTSADGLTFTSTQVRGEIIVKVADTWRYTLASGVVETYNNSGQLVLVTNQQGLSQVLTYTEGRLTSITDPSEHTLTFGYDELGRLSQIIDPNNQITYYQYGQHGNLIAVIYPDDTVDNELDNPKTVYGYTNPILPYKLTKRIDANGNVDAQWNYDASGRAISSVNNRGYKSTTIMLVDGNAEITDANGHTRTLTFDNKGRLSTMTGGDCGECSNSGVASYEYDTTNRLISKTDFNGVITKYEYNERNLQTKRTEGYGTALARTTNTEWHDNLSIVIQVTTPTMRINKVYSDSGRLEQVSETDLINTKNSVRITRYQYDDQGLLSVIDGVRDDVNDLTTLTYNANRDLTHITDAVGNVTAITTRDAHGHPTRVIDANGHISTFTYDVRNRLVSQAIDGNTSFFNYDNIGQLIKVTHANGDITHYQYSAARLLTAIYDEKNNRIEYQHDLMGNVTQVDVKDSDGTLFSTQQQIFDNLNRLETLTDGLSNTTSYGYDGVGNQVSVTSALQKETQHVYDELNRVKESIDGEKNKTLYGYDSANNLTSVTAANNAHTKYQYDGFGQLLQQESPDTGITRFTYDIAGNQVSKIDATNVTVLYNYDALNRLTKVDYRGDDNDITLEYDTGVNGKGRLSKLFDGSGTTTYSYNALGGVTKKSTTILGEAFNVHYDYDSMGQIKSLTLPSGKVVTYVYDTLGELSDITTKKNDVDSTLLTSINYVPFGAAKKYSLGNNKVVTKQHNLNGQLTGINVPSTYQSTLGFNADNLITAIEDSKLPSNNQSFEYDNVNRVTSATGEYGELGFDYDSSGNRLSNYQNNQSSTHTYMNSTNQLEDGYEHDQRGNRVQDSTRHYRYGDNNRLIEVVNDVQGLKTTYLYNGLGQRVQKNNVFGIVYYLYDEQGLLIAEADKNGLIQKEYLYFEGQPLVMFKDE